MQSLEVSSTKVDASNAFNGITMVLVDRGFDIKASNEAAGLITTEYKKFASLGGSPPFDFYLQVKALVKKAGDGEIQIKLVPTVKEQNRMNAAAFTERELTYYEGEPATVQKIKTMKEDGWQHQGQTLFMNVAHDVSALTGVSIEEMTHNTTKVEESVVAF